MARAVTTASVPLHTVRGRVGWPEERPCANALLYQHHYLGERWLARRGTASRLSPVDSNSRMLSRCGRLYGGLGAS